MPPPPSYWRIMDENFLEEYGQDYLDHLIENGFLVVEKNEFGENVYGIGEGLEEESPLLYQMMMQSARYIVDVLMTSDLVSAYYDDYGNEYYYATERGEEFFLDLIRARSIYLKNNQ